MALFHQSNSSESLALGYLRVREYLRITGCRSYQTSITRSKSSSKSVSASWNPIWCVPKFVQSSFEVIDAWRTYNFFRHRFCVSVCIACGCVSCFFVNSQRFHYVFAIFIYHTLSVLICLFRLYLHRSSYMLQLAILALVVVLCMTSLWVLVESLALFCKFSVAESGIWNVRFHRWYKVSFCLTSYIAFEPTAYMCPEQIWLQLFNNWSR